MLEGKPLIDEFGQYTHAEWPGKAHSLDELKMAWSAEEAALKTAPSDRARQASVSPDGTTLCVASFDGTLAIWDLGEDRRGQVAPGEVEHEAEAAPGASLRT